MQFWPLRVSGAGPALAAALSDGDAAAARQPTVAQLVTEIARNIKSVEADGSLLQQIDLEREY